MATKLTESVLLRLILDAKNSPESSHIVVISIQPKCRLFAALPLEENEIRNKRF